MTDNEQIFSDQIRSLLIVLGEILPAVHWSELPADSREMVDMEIKEAREAVGLAESCERGTCRL